MGLGHLVPSGRPELTAETLPALDLNAETTEYRSLGELVY